MRLFTEVIYCCTEGRSWKGFKWCGCVRWQSAEWVARWDAKWKY